MKKIVLGVTGSIAAYKALEIVRNFKKAGEDVVCVLTKEAIEFVTPLSFSTLSGNEVLTELFGQRKTPVHIELADCNLILVAPATYNFIGKVANGIADDLLSCVIAASRSPVIFAPCMDTNMWENKLLQDNVSELKSVGYHFIDPEVGKLSTLKIGKGRFPEPELIVKECYRIMKQAKMESHSPLRGKKIIVTAGRTEEKLDPIRCITNRSSGRMGYAIAEEVQMRGGNVTLISGLSTIPAPYGIELVEVRTTSELADEVLSRVTDADVLIMVAAVADYTPARYSSKKIKDKFMEVKFKRTQNILKLVRNKKKDLFIVGFSLETDNLIKNAKAKLKDKLLDLMVANDVSALESEKASVTLIDKVGTLQELSLLPKDEIAKQIINWIAKNYAKLRIKN